MSLTISNLVPTTGVILLYFPKWESVSLGAILPGSMVDDVTSCTALSDISGSSPTCTVTINSVSTGQDLITVTNAFSSLNSSLVSGKTISIKVSTVRNPPTL
jgi:hypothetical protein